MYKYLFLVMTVILCGFELQGNDLKSDDSLFHFFMQTPDLFHKDLVLQQEFAKLKDSDIDEEEKNVRSRELFLQILELEKGSYINEPNKIKMLIVGIKDDSKEIRKKAITVLAENVLQKNINENSKEIYDNLELGKFFVMLEKQENIRPEYGRAIRLVGRLNTLTAEEKSLIFNSSQIELDVKAKLGDKKSEDAIIETFQNTDDYDEMRELSKQLGYIATADSIKTLLNGLNSSVKTEWQHGEVSIRCEIINALSKALPTEKIFTKDLGLLSVGRFSPSVEKDKLRKKYAQEVNKWAQEHYGFTVWNPDEVWFKFSYDTPIF